MEPPGVLTSDNVTVNTSTINQITTSTSIGGVSTSASQQTIERLSRPMAFDKMENLVKEMQDSETGVPVRSQKLFLTSIPSAFMGYDLIEWLMERLTIEESEALNIANQLCLHGYFFPVNDSKNLVVKDDSSLYRFQTPYYWPWQHKAPDNVEYAIYLAKRSLRNKQRHGLEDYEAEALANLHKNLKGKWDFITMQAEEQVKLAKERKKGDKIVGDSQERAYWRVHRPPPGQFTPLEPCPVPSRDRQGKPRKRTIDDWQREVDFLTTSLGRTRMKMSQACECLVSYYETFSEYDPMITQPLPSNPWVSEDIAFWQLNNSIVEIPTEKRVKRWAISIEETVSDPTGLQEFTSYLKKEYSHENIRFWLAVNDLRRSSHSMIPRKVKEIYEEFLAPGAPCEINIDGKTMENVQQGLKSPSRFAFDSAAEHIYALLLKKDCYPRFIRSEHYKSLLASGIQPSHKKRFFVFGGAAKKKSTTTAPNPTLLTQASTSTSANQGNLTRRRGSDRSLSGSAHELAVSGVKDSTKVPHSHSQSNLSDIPYREASKSFTDNLEPTLEGTGACAVCPWETAETSNVSVSVCPWEGETITSSIVTTNTSAKQIPSIPSTSSDCRFKNFGLENLGNISSDISEVSERMKKSCGLRQNTLDGDFHSTKRLNATVVEHRRASVTATPRASDLQYLPKRPMNIDLPQTSFYQDSIFLTSSSNITKGASHQSALLLGRATSFEEKDLGNLLKQPLSVSENDSNNSVDNKKCSKNLNENNEKTINVDDNSIIKNENLKTISEINNDNKVFSNSKNNSANLINLPLEMESENNSSVVQSGSTPSLTRTTPPTINVLTCPTIEVSSKEIEKDPCVNVNNEEDQIMEDQKTNEETQIVMDSPTVNLVYKEEVQVVIEPPPSFASTSQEILNKITENKLENNQKIEIEKRRGSQSAVKLKTLSEDDEVAMQDDLSPTTEEYRECIAAFQHQDTGENEDFSEITTGVTQHLTPGCVAPAPTPAPSIAPLAEVEIDPPEDDGDIEIKQEIEISKETEVKKKRKKRSSQDKTDSQDKPTSSDENSKTNEQQKHFAVCPWEDEDHTTTVDQPFVKTYSTLGYL